MHFLNILVTACLLPLYLYTSFSDYVVGKVADALLCSEIQAVLSHWFLLLSWHPCVNTVVWLKCSCWLLSALLYCRCLTTPPNPSRRRLTVTPQMASLYSSSLMPALSPSRWYPAWGKKWSVTVTRRAISWLQAKSGTLRAVVHQSDWYRKAIGRLHVVIITISAFLRPKQNLKMFTFVLQIQYFISYFQCRFKGFSSI